MKRTLRIFSIVTFILLLISCEQHYYFLNKVKVNTNETSLKTVKLLPLQSLNISNNTDSNDIVNKSAIAQKEVSKNDFRVDTPKPFIIKKHPVIVDEPAQEKKKKEIYETSDDSDEKRFSVTKKIGFIFMLLFIGSIIYVSSKPANTGGQADYMGCLVLTLTFILLFIPGIIMIIVG
jgi:ATP-dependent Zn protease